MREDRKDEAGLFQAPDNEVLMSARKILRGARFGAIAVKEPETGYPFASRVLLGTDVDGVPVVLCSELATHTKAMLRDPHCSLLVGEPGKGDPLAWPRLTVQAKATRIDPAIAGESIRGRFLRRHPKASLYVDFGDFAFFKIEPESALFNGGFSKSYKILKKQLIIHSSLNEEIIKNELCILGEIANLRPEVGSILAKVIFREKSSDWRLVNLDASGFELAYKERILRQEFPQPVQDLKGLIAYYSNILMEIR